MNEKVIEALIQLFALIVKQDKGISSGERAYVECFLDHLEHGNAREYLQLLEKIAVVADEQAEEVETEKKLMSVKTEVRVLATCKKFTKMTMQQKVVMLMRIFEFVNVERSFTQHKRRILNICADMFGVSDEDFQSIETFVLKDAPEELDRQNILLASGEKFEPKNAVFVETPELQGIIAILYLPSVDLFFLEYTGNETVLLNGLVVKNHRVYLFVSGSRVDMPNGNTVYYSDVVSHFLANDHNNKFSNGWKTKFLNVLGGLK